MFFSDGKVTDLRAFQLPVAGRLLLAFLVVGLYPTALLAVTSVSRAGVLVGAGEPEAVLNSKGPLR